LKINNKRIQEAEVRRIMVWSQLGQIVHEILSWKNPSEKGWLSGSKCRPWVQTLVPQE
jgi:hypothetical protein